MDSLTLYHVTVINNTMCTTRFLLKLLLKLLSLYTTIKLQSRVVLLNDY